MVFNIIINKRDEEEKRGRVGTHDDFLKLLTREEIKKIFEQNAWDSIKEVFEVAKKASEDTYLLDASGILVNLISDGYKIHTLVFYL